MPLGEAKNVAKKHLDIHNIVKESGPGLAVLFMALLVKSELKLGNKDLFDATNFSFTGLFVE